MLDEKLTTMSVNGENIGVYEGCRVHIFDQDRLASGLAEKWLLPRDLTDQQWSSLTWEEKFLSMAADRTRCWNEAERLQIKLDQTTLLLMVAAVTIVCILVMALFY